MEQKFVADSQGSGIFGGRRKAGHGSLYVKGTEPENVVDISSTNPKESDQLLSSFTFFFLPFDLRIHCS